jgi:hypothetical protein
MADLASAHRSNGFVRLERDNLHQYLARFAVDKDSLFHAKARVRLVNPYEIPFNANIKILLMNDMEWDMALETDD